MDTSCPRPIMLCFCFCRHTTWHLVKTWEFLIATSFFKHFMKKPSCHLPAANHNLPSSAAGFISPAVKTQESNQTGFPE